MARRLGPSRWRHFCVNLPKKRKVDKNWKLKSRLKMVADIYRYRQMGVTEAPTRTTAATLFLFTKEPCKRGCVKVSSFHLECILDGHSTVPRWPVFTATKNLYTCLKKNIRMDDLMLKPFLSSLIGQIDYLLVIFESVQGIDERWRRLQVHWHHYLLINSWCLLK